MVQRWEEAKTKTRGGFIDRKREGVKVGKGLNGRFFLFFSPIFFLRFALVQSFSVFALGALSAVWVCALYCMLVFSADVLAHTLRLLFETPIFTV